MTTITRQQIQDRLQVNEMQLEMAEFSGLIPASETGEWQLAHVEPFLNNWEAKLSRKQPKVDNNLKSANMIFPKHQR
jgi:uncharacterized protein HemX